MNATDTQTVYDSLIRSAARKLTGFQRRQFQTEVTQALCSGNARQAEIRFGWGRQTIRKGQQEAETGVQVVPQFQTRGRKKLEDLNPQLTHDIRSIAEPKTQADPELKSSRRYTNLSAREVREKLRDEKGYTAEQLPSERSLRTVLNRLGYRLKRIQKCKPKKTTETDAIFDNIASVKKKYDTCSKTLQVSIDTKSKVAEGDFSRRGKCRTDSSGGHPKALDHDENVKRKWTPFGILVLAVGAATASALTILFNSSKETSDFWADCLIDWWENVKSNYKEIERIVIYLDNGPNSSGRRTQWLKRMTEFAYKYGIEVRLVYYPPYHSKYNPIERCWGILERKWNGSLLSDIEKILSEASRMRWDERSPTVGERKWDYKSGVRVGSKEMKQIEAGMRRSATLPKHDITINSATSRIAG